MQELIAPKDVFFFDREWNYRGSKMSLAAQLSDITGVSKGLLRGEISLASFSIAQKLSWAAHRETTRVEDIAYCLLGIFDVNMPLLYGEEGSAFRRLQQEIMKSTADLSILAWRLPSTGQNTSSRVLTCVLADTPAAFSGCGTFEPLFHTELTEFSVTNIGVKTRAQVLRQIIPGTGARRYALPLNCFYFQGLPIRRRLAVRLKKVGPEIFLREDPWTLLEYTEELGPNVPLERYLLTEIPDRVRFPYARIVSMDALIPRMRLHALQISLPPDMEIRDAWPRRFDDEDQLFFTGNSRGDSAVLKLSTHFGFENGGTKWRFVSIFYAVGWSSHSAQFSLLDSQDFASKVGELQLGIADWDHDKEGILDQLTYHKIPRSSAVAFEIPKTSKSALVSLTRHLVSEPTMCANEFWRVEFSYQVHETSEMPPIEQDEWVLRET